MTDQLSADELGAGDAADAAAADATAATGSTTTPTGSWLVRRREQRRTRVSRWDRPPEPRDWRFFVGGLGRVLIVTGLLLFGFVAYQLWGTGIETARAQNRLENEFEQLIARYGDDPEPEAPVAGDDGDDGADEGVSADDGSGPDVVDVDAPDEPDRADDADTAAEPATDPTGDLVVAADAVERVDLSAVAVEQDIPPFERGDPLALLEIPAIGTSDIVVPGVALDDLKSGPGHYPDTPLPGQLGNAAIAGHRTTYGAPFFDVDQLVPGDELIVTMFTGDRFVYVVTSIEVVGASDYWVVSTSEPTIAEMTLTSCHPKYTARDRIIVHSVLDPDRSSIVGVPTPYDLGSDSDEPIPGDDPVVADDTVDQPADVAGDGSDGPATAAETPEPEGSTSDDPSEPVTEPDSADGDDRAAPVPAPAPTAANPGEGEDVFVNGWFDDRGAWPQIALWGSVLVLIALLAHRVSRRFRNLAVGTALGLLPFLVALYFFYQNVNRLLPPGL